MNRPADFAALAHTPAPPHRGVSVAIYLGAVTLMYLVRFVWFRDALISLSWGLPLLLCVWHRDRALLWAMTATFLALATYKTFYVLPAGGVFDLPTDVQLVMQWINTLVIAGVVHLTHNLLARLERKRLVIEQANHELADRQEEIARQNEELQMQSEELAQQNAQIQQQAEEMQHQTEELAAQAEELQQTNRTLARREALLQTLMESLHLAEDDDSELPARICQPVLRLFHEAASAVAIVERAGDDLVVLAQSGVGPLDRERWPFARSFASVVMAHDRTAFVDDLEARPDLIAPGTAGRKFRSVLATPLRIHGQIAGAVKIYSEQPRSWTAEQFRMIEWVAAQCALLLECHRLRRELQRSNAELDAAVARRTAELRELVQDLEHFSYTITHDLRAPLRAMHGFAGMLAQECGEHITPEGKEYLRRIGVAAARMDRLITDALSYSGTVRQEFKLEPVDIEQLLRGIVDSYPNLQTPLASVTLAGSFPRVLGNEAALTQCFANLLGNAVKFVAPGRTPHVRVHAEQRGEWVRVWFEDDGIGIPEAMLSRVFGMFQRLSKNYEGTGIGLALVKKVAERMGGAVGVESQLGRGSRFWLELKTA